MKISVLNQKGEKVSDLQLSKAFDVEISDESLTLYVNYLRNALRGPVANSKDRSEVSGGGRKPYKQKGTGRARPGSTRSPLWVGGGVTFGPSSEQNFRTRINKNLKKKVILGVIADAARQNKLIILDSLAMAEPKTKAAVNVLSNIKAEGKISLVLSDTDSNCDKSFGNIEGVNLMMPGRLNVINILSSNNIVLSEKSLEQIEALYTSNKQ